MNVTDTSAEITGLEKGSTYKFYVVSQNEHGTSVPSAMVQVKVSSEGEYVSVLKQNLRKATFRIEMQFLKIRLTNYFISVTCKCHIRVDFVSFNYMPESINY